MYRKATSNERGDTFFSKYVTTKDLWYTEIEQERQTLIMTYRSPVLAACTFHLVQRRVSKYQYPFDSGHEFISLLKHIKILCPFNIPN
jgi:hypothetical protein